MKTGVIIQARMASTRLPAKVAKELPYASGITVIEQVVRRLRKCRVLDCVVVATTTDKSDDTLVKLVRKAGAKLFRGSKNDVLSRYYYAAKKFRMDTVVRITSDCPCVDPSLVDSMVGVHLARHADYTANVVKTTFPDGYDVEVLGFKSLRTAFEKSVNPQDREHVTSYIRNRPGEFRVASVRAPAWGRRPELRVTLDTPDDYLLLCAIYDQLYSHSRPFTFREVISLFRRKPWLEQINRRSLPKKRSRTINEELRQAVSLLELQELDRAAEVFRKILKK
ncbi:MAG TPA: acylneuraminate cytidylyltransferase [Elusimicrobia bacterium]|nr:acylneuraminate cytidylyltransferase [Elusimicrobiota bacterium]